MFNKLAGRFYWHKTRPASLLNDFKNIPGKVCFNGVDNNDAFMNAGNLPRGGGGVLPRRFVNPNPI